MKQFNMLNASSKFAICGLPLRVDCYKTCAFNCDYCFSNNRKIMEFGKTLQVGNIALLAKQMERVYSEKIIRSDSFIDKLMESKITWHCGGMSDPFQPCEGVYHITKRLVELTKEYKVSVLFSTKSDDLHGCDFDQSLHTFQFSVSNVNDSDIERNVPTIESRYRLYKELKSEGFRVGIRLQPFIPGLSDERIVELFNDADHFTIEGLKLVPQNKEHVEMVLNKTGLQKSSFTQMGLLNLKPEIRYELYKPIVSALEYYAIPYSIADNDMHHLSQSKCCCGDSIVEKSSGFDTTAMCYEFGRDYTFDQVSKRFSDFADCKVNHLFTSNRQESCRTLSDFYSKRFDRKSSPFSPKFLCDFDFLPTDEIIS